jgi:lysophospholipase
MNGPAETPPPFHADVANAPPGAEAHWLTTTDGVRLRAVTWPAGDRGTAVILPGRTEFAEKYGRVAGRLVDRGFSVAVID